MNFCGLGLAPHGWDGNPDIYVPQRCTAFQTFAAEYENTEPLSDSSDSEDDRGKIDSYDKLTRQEKKAMDREIPWRSIMKQGKRVIDKYVEANIKERKSWMAWDTIRPLHPEEARKVMQDPLLRKRIIPARNKSLFDAVISANPSLSEKRTLIAVRSVQDFLSSEDIRWIPTGVMRADGLTTVNAQLHDEFRRWLQRPTITLREDKAAPDWQKKNRAQAAPFGYH